MKRKICIGILTASAFLALLNASALAQTAYPIKPIRMIVPFSPGGTSDTLARILGQKMTEAWGQQVVVDSRPGASGIIGTEIAMRAAPDGYTLMHGNMSQFAINPSLYARLPYETLRDFAPLSLIATAPQLLVVNPAVPAKSVKELIDLARASPRKLNVASPGVGTPNHLGAAQLMTLTGIELVHVPYKGSSLAVTDLISGNVQILVTGLLQTLPHHRTGRLRILGVGHPQRLKAYPDIPAIAETVPGYYNTGWWGIVAPAGTPKAIVARLNAIMNKALTAPETLQRFEKNGLEVATTTPQGFHEMIRSDLQMWKKLIKDAKISVDVLP